MAASGSWASAWAHRNCMNEWIPPTYSPLYTSSSSTKVAVQSSVLISCKQLACLTGGSVYNIQHQNVILQVGTPIQTSQSSSHPNILLLLLEPCQVSHLIWSLGNNPSGKDLKPVKIMGVESLDLCLIITNGQISYV